MKFCFALLVLIISCNTNNLNADEKAVRSLLDTIIHADNRADISTVLSCYRNDAVLMPPGKPSITGIHAIEVNYKTIFANSVLHLESHIEEVKIFPSYAIVTGTNSGSVVLKKDSSVVTVSDKYIMLLNKQNDTWKIKKLIWNKNQ